MAVVVATAVVVAPTLSSTGCLSALDLPSVATHIEAIAVADCGLLSKAVASTVAAESVQSTTANALFTAEAAQIAEFTAPAAD